METCHVQFDSYLLVYISLRLRVTLIIAVQQDLETLEFPVQKPSWVGVGWKGLMVQTLMACSAVPGRPGEEK